MKQVLMIPDVNNLSECEKIAEKYHLGYEYNDFYRPDILDNPDGIKKIIEKYKDSKLPEYCTLHGAFLDVIPTSMDEQVRKIGELRIRQSLDIARQLGSVGVVFHTNYNPFLNNREYIEQWIRENVRFWSKILEEYTDIHIYLENMFDTSPDILQILSAELSAHSNYGVCLDYAHAALSKTDLDIWAEKLGKYVRHIHLNDNDLVSDLHLSWGEGQIDRQKFYRLYEMHMKNATILIETSSLKGTEESLEVLKNEGFLTER